MPLKCHDNMLIIYIKADFMERVIEIVLRIGKCPYGEW